MTCDGNHLQRRRRNAGCSQLTRSDAGRRVRIPSISTAAGAWSSRGKDTLIVAGRKFLHGCLNNVVMDPTFDDEDIGLPLYE